MAYGYLGQGDLQGQRFTIPKGQFIAGHAIGIVHLEVWYPLLPGNVVNATTYDFPVLYKVLQGGTQDRIHSADPTVMDLIIEAGRELEQQGVRAIAGACGYLGNYQRQVAAALDVPVFLSSLLQVPMLHRSLKPGQRVGIMCADAPSITPRLLEACGVTPDIPIAVMGLGDEPQFSNILYSRGEFDHDEIEQEVIDGARRLVTEHPDVGAILLECSDMPPFAWAVQHAVGLPVFDFITMINWIYHGVVQRPYEGLI
jgi:Asp/Glu/hydantoin racemase